MATRGRGTIESIYGDRADLPGQPVPQGSGATGGSRSLVVPLGGAQNITLMAGLDAVVTRLDSITKEMGKAAKEMHVQTVQQATYGASPRAKRQATELVLSEAGGTELTPHGPVKRGAARSPGADESRGHAHSAYSVSPASEGQMSMPSSQGYEEQRVSSAVPMSNAEIIDHARHFSVGQARQDVARSWQRRLSEWHWGPQYTYNDQAQRWQDPNTHRFVSNQAGEKMMRRERITGKVQNALGSMAQGRGILQAGAEILPRGMAMGAGYVVGGAVLANQALNFAQGQRAANNRWQQIMGGSNAEGFRMRAGQTAFEWAQKGFMGAGEAGKLYQGVYSMNYRGSRAAGAMQFGLDNYGRYGMSADQSLEILNTAANTGQEALIGLAKSLDVVTKSAREAGMNAGNAQQLFSNLFKTTSATGGIASAPALAAGATAFQTSLGPSFQNADFSGMLGGSVTIDRIMAARMGMTYGQFMAARSKDPAFGARAAAQNAAQASLQVVGGRGRALIEQKKAQMGLKAGDTMSPAQAREIGDALMSAGIVDPQQAASVLGSMTGQTNIDPNEVASMLVHNITSPTALVRDVTEARGEQRAHAIKGATGKGDTELRRQSLLKNREIKDIEHGFGWRTGAQQKTSDVFETDGGMFGVRTYKGKVNDSRRLYLAAVDRTGVRSPLVEKLLASGTDTSMRLRVKTKDHRDRVVTLDNALRYFYDQLVTGEAEIVKGQDAGQTVSQATGTEGTSIHDANEGGGRLINTAKSKMTDDMKSAGDTWKKSDASKRKAAGTGKLIIEPSPQLAELLRFRGQGAYDVQQSRYSGTPPSTSTTPSERGNNGAG